MIPSNKWSAFEALRHSEIYNLLLLRVDNANSILELILDSHRLLSFYQPTVIEEIKLELLNFKDLTSGNYSGFDQRLNYPKLTLSAAA